MNIEKALIQANNGNPGASDSLFELVYDELRRIARQQLQKENRGHTLQATALANEAWLKLVGGKTCRANWKDRKHFFSVAAKAMQRILVDAARIRNRQKRNGNVQRALLSENEIQANSRDSILVELDEALQLLEQRAPVKAELVRLRYFVGLTNAEASHHLGISTATAERYFAFARAFLRDQIESIQ